MRFILSGGGTAGHIYPALALCEELQKRGHEVYFAGTPRGVEARLVTEAQIPFKAFNTTGFNRNHPSTIFKAVSNMLRSTKEAKAWLAEIKPDAVIGFGAYVCIPVGRAALSMNIPLIIHEQNSVMGLANKYLSRKAACVAVTYEESASHVSDQSKVQLTGNPVRNSVLTAKREEGRSYLEIPADALMLLVFGGSLGARHINSAIAQLKDRLLAHENLFIVHLTGPKEYETVVDSLALNASQQERWKVFGYQDRMGEVLAAADIVVARAGATSLAEISARKIPAILVPFPFATEDHQTTNAKAYIERGAAFMVADDDLDSVAFEQALFRLIEDAGVRQSMKEAAAEFKTENAAVRLADVVIAATHT